MSDTIIMYENGKAVGGEGHPTNADEITFNNEDTDLVSEEVESAIKEVNAKFDKGSVSVTADGVKTCGQLFNELFALVDMSKVTAHTKLIDGGNVFTLTTKGNNTPPFLMFAVEMIFSSVMYSIQETFTATGSKREVVTNTYTQTNVVYGDETSVVYDNGRVLRIEY